MERAIETGVLFPLIFTAIYLPVCLICYMLSGLYKKGWDRIKKELSRNIVFNVYLILGYVVFRFLYLTLPDYWKLVGTGFALLVIAIPTTLFITYISGLIYEDRKRDLLRLGWRETVEGDYKNWEEYLWEHSYEYHHPKHGIHNITEAEKICQ